MADQVSRQDANRFPALIAHTGTAGTAEVVRVTSGSVPGAIDVNIAGTAVNTGRSNINIVTGTQQTLGTVGVVNNLVGGTLGSILGIGGTVAVSGASAGTVVEVNKGTINLGTVSISNTPTVNMASGTINVGTATVSGTVSIPSATGFEGGTVSVGTVAVELTFTGITKGIMVTADHNNGTMVYLGPATITQAGANAVARIDPGESLSIEDFNDATASLYAVAGTTAQKVYKVAFT